MDENPEMMDKSRLLNVRGKYSGDQPTGAELATQDQCEAAERKQSDGGRLRHGDELQARERSLRGGAFQISVDKSGSIGRDTISRVIHPGGIKGWRRGRGASGHGLDRAIHIKVDRVGLDAGGTEQIEGVRGTRGEAAETKSCGITRGESKTGNGRGGIAVGSVGKIINQGIARSINPTRKSGKIERANAVQGHENRGRASR